MSAPSAPRPFSWGVTAFGAGVINFIINAPLGWFMVREGTRLGIWTVPGVAADLVATAFGVAFGTALIVPSQIRKQVERGQLLPPPLAERWRKMFASWPSSTAIRAFNLGVWGVLLFAPLPLLALYLLDLQPLDRLTVTLLKGSFAFIEGALVTPVIAAAATVPVKS
ncbi:MAG TPA: hypothetical protein VK509_16710 [Polyangiales bacterium]|nr:hypothetical protein [Polyangiales bacterium]